MTQQSEKIMHRVGLLHKYISRYTVHRTQHMKICIHLFFRNLFKNDVILKFNKNIRYFTLWLYLRGRDWLRAGRSGDRIPMEGRFFVHVTIVARAHPASCTMGTGTFPVVKRPGRGADHPPPSVEVKKEYSYTCTSSGPSGLLRGIFTFM
jgi:hypothetical protein